MVDDDGAVLRCVVCGGGRHRVVFLEDGVEIVRCGDCRHVYSTYEADPNFDGYWDAGDPASDAFYWDAAHARMYGAFVARLLAAPRGRLLDVGCGLGFFVRHVERSSSWEASGWEISRVAAEYASRELGLRNVYTGPFEGAGLPDTDFDLVTMWDVFEHLKEPDELLAKCHRLLKPGGRLFLHTPNVELQLPKARVKKAIWGIRGGMGYLQPRDHLNHYSPKSVRRVLERNGFASLEFLHLPPIESVEGRRSPAMRSLKNFGFAAVRAVAAVTGGRVNLDNLFVVTRKE